MSGDVPAGIVGNGATSVRCAPGSPPAISPPIPTANVRSAEDAPPPGAPGSLLPLAVPRGCAAFALEASGDTLAWITAVAASAVVLTPVASAPSSACVSESLEQAARSATAQPATTANTHHSRRNNSAHRQRRVTARHHDTFRPAGSKCDGGTVEHISDGEIQDNRSGCHRLEEYRCHDKVPRRVCVSAQWPIARDVRLTRGRVTIPEGGSWIIRVTLRRRRNAGPVRGRPAQRVFVEVGIPLKARSANDGWRYQLGSVIANNEIESGEPTGAATGRRRVRYNDPDPYHVAGVDFARALYPRLTRTEVDDQFYPTRVRPGRRDSVRIGRGAGRSFWQIRDHCGRVAWVAAVDLFDVLLCHPVRRASLRVRRRRRRVRHNALGVGARRRIRVPRRHRARCRPRRACCTGHHRTASPRRSVRSRCAAGRRLASGCPALCCRSRCRRTCRIRARRAVVIIAAATAGHRGH